MEIDLNYAEKVLSDEKLQNLPLAMGYVPLQKWQKLYRPDTGLSRGTLFEELDLPFIGEEAVPHDK